MWFERLVESRWKAPVVLALVAMIGGFSTAVNWLIGQFESEETIRFSLSYPLTVTFSFALLFACFTGMSAWKTARVEVMAMFALAILVGLWTGIIISAIDMRKVINEYESPARVGLALPMKGEER